MMQQIDFLKLKYEFVIETVGDDTMAVGVGDGAFHGMILLKNDSAEFIFRKLQKGILLPDLIRACADRYGEAEKDVEPDVVSFVEELRENGIVNTGIRYN